MELKKKLSTRIGKDEIDHLIQLVNDNKISIDEIIKLLRIKETQFQASWLLTHTVEKNPGILKVKHIKALAKIIEKTNHEGLERNIWRSLNFIEIPSYLHETLINTGFEKLENHKTAVAIQVFSMSVLEKLLINEVELQLALKAILELKMERQPSPGLKSRATKIINKINSQIDH
ncbi:hypothetical protein [Marivirga sp.]|uniref:hypothetical protein n=1 Tax=Marivirga sp. TaxID=2018662 RepID=UPI003DA740CC